MQSVVSDERVLLWDSAGQSSDVQWWQAADSVGLHLAYSIPVWDVAGSRALFSVAAASCGDSYESHVAWATSRLVWLAHVSHSALSAELDRIARVAYPALTTREVEVLRWTGDGKSASDIAALMRISENTVTFHIKNATNKLVCSNKAGAVVKAALLGMLA